MRLLQLHRHNVHTEHELPEAASVYEAAIRKLTLAHETEAAAYLAQCKLEIIETGGVHALGEQLHPVRLVLTGPGDVVAELEQNAQLFHASAELGPARDDVVGLRQSRQALDAAIGPTIYLAQMAVSARSSVLAA